MGKKPYETPKLSDYGDLQDLTASNREPVFVDVPEGTPIVGGDIGAVVGDDMS